MANTLNAQEKRNAKFSGFFKQFCVKEAVKRLEFWRNYEIFSATDISRMLEVQFISDVTVNFLDGLTSYSSSKLNKYYKLYDEKFEREEEIKQRLENVFNVIINLSPNAIKETIFKRAPLFFSLVIIIDSLDEINVSKIENGLFEIDAIFNSDIPISEREKDDIEFYNASSSTTQGLEQRKIRDAYIRKFIK